MISVPEDFPRFKYHPNPLATGSIEPSPNTCLCCGRARGYIYGGSPYAVRNDLSDAICPWCIADGSAAEKFAASFFQDYEDLHSADGSEDNDGHVGSGGSLAPAIEDELAHRTPGYVSWQGELWLVHCHDAMAFHGDVSNETLADFDPATRERIQDELPFLFGGWFKDWDHLVEGYQPRGDVALYHFKCLHCGIDRLGCDLS